MQWHERIHHALASRQQAGLLRQRTAVELKGQGQLQHQGKSYHHFSSNDYLGLSQHPAVIDAWCQGARQWGTGAGASGHVTGYSPLQQHFEQSLANWLGFPRAILFSSGYAANQALIFALAQTGDRLIADKLVHASLQEAAALSPADYRRFQHNSLAGLQRLLENRQGAASLVITEGVFSMDGDQAPLAAIADLCQQHNAWLMVDDAHGLGVLGKFGRGSCEQAAIKPDIQVVTFGKALGVSGAAILCSEAVADYLEQCARHLIYSTALSAAQINALLASLTVVQTESSHRQRLQHNITYFKQQAARLPVNLLPSATAIQPLIIGENLQTLAVAAQLRDCGYWLQAIRPPTVPAGSARLRITLSAAHSVEQIDGLIEALRDIN